MFLLFEAFPELVAWTYGNIFVILRTDICTSAFFVLKEASTSILMQHSPHTVSFGIAIATALALAPHTALEADAYAHKRANSDCSATAKNIIFFLVDDMGWQDTSVPFWTERTPYNNTYHTPNMERLAARGMIFTQAYACAISSPSRCSLITGTNAARHRVTNWTMERGVSTDMPSEDYTLPDWNVNGVSPTEGTERTFVGTSFVEILHQAGYHTIHCGKAHFGALTTPGEDPLHWGFDVNIAGHAAGGLATYLSEKNYGHTPDGQPYALNAIPGLEKYWGTGTFATEALTQEALAALDRRPLTQSSALLPANLPSSSLKKPFFLYMAHYAVHTPIDRDERFYQQYIDRGLDPREAAYASLIEGMDKSLGDLMDWLDRNNETDNTIIIFMSDNGGLATQPEWRGGPLYTQNAPLACGKGSLLEGGIREPMIVCWPGTVTGGTRCTTDYVMIEDFYPTLLEMAGIDSYQTLQPIDGMSFVPLLKGKRGISRHRPLVWNFPNIWGNDGPGINLCCAIRQDDWKLIYHYDTGAKELYNIASDIGETRNLATQHRRLTERLSRRLGQYLRSVDAQRPVIKQTGLPCPWPDEVKGVKG